MSCRSLPTNSIVLLRGMSLGVDVVFVRGVVSSGFGCELFPPLLSSASFGKLAISRQSSFSALQIL